MSDTVAVYVPAKINLALCVGGPRPDGFHELQTLFQAVSLYDELTLTKLPSGIEVEVPGFPELDRGNTCQTVAEIMIAGANLDAGVRVKVDKQIPVALGISLPTCWLRWAATHPLASSVALPSVLDAGSSS